MSVKLLMRQVGTPHKGLEVISEVELNQYIDYQFTSQGYRLFETHYLGEVRNEQKGIQGYKFAFVFVTSDSLAEAKSLSGQTEAVAPKRPGRPPKGK